MDVWGTIKEEREKMAKEVNKGNIIIGYTN